jgi:DnaJ-class molecular chaperone
LDTARTNHYHTLGLDYDCTVDDVRAAYRFLAKQHHPDMNPDAPDARLRTQELVAANEVLSNPKRRRDYDRSLRETKRSTGTSRTGRIERDISQEVHVRIEDFFYGITMDVQVRDPANDGCTETYELAIKPLTAPGSRIRVARSKNIDGGFVILKLKALPGFQFKARGSDLKCDLNISTKLAAKGGTHSVKGALGNILEIEIPRGAARGEIIRIAEEGLPKARGGRGDLFVRVTYRPQVTISRSRYE